MTEFSYYVVGHGIVEISLGLPERGAEVTTVQTLWPRFRGRILNYSHVIYTPLPRVLIANLESYAS